MVADKSWLNSYSLRDERRAGATGTPQSSSASLVLVCDARPRAEYMDGGVGYVSPDNNDLLGNAECLVSSNGIICKECYWPITNDDWLLCSGGCGRSYHLGCIDVMHYTIRGVGVYAVPNYPMQGSQGAETYPKGSTHSDSSGISRGNPKLRKSPFHHYIMAKAFLFFIYCSSCTSSFKETQQENILDHSCEAASGSFL